MKLQGFRTFLAFVFIEGSHSELQSDKFSMPQQPTAQGGFPFLATLKQVLRSGTRGFSFSICEMGGKKENSCIRFERNDMEGILNL